MPLEKSSTRNALLRRLGEDDLSLLAPDMEPFELPRHSVLYRRDEPFGHVYFFDGGIGSLVAISPEGQRVEAGLMGRDGFTPAAAALGTDRTSHEASVQADACGWRIGLGRFRAALDRSASLREPMLRYAYCFQMQISYTALSNAVHPIDERLARWLLMCHDRVDGDELGLTHDFISLMLAVRRPSVTTALHVLEGNGFIRAERGLVTIRDRAAMRAFAGDAYGVPEREYERLIGPFG